MSDRVPSVSIVMSVHNDASYLQESVDSMLEQSLSDFEFIIVDDFSSDDSWDILNRYAQQDSRIILIKNTENLKLAASLNRGLAIARGKYIARMDGDDISLPSRLQEQVDYMEAHPDVALVSTGVLYVDESGQPIEEYFPPLNSLILRWKLIFSSPLRHPTVLWRRELIQSSIGGYNPTDIYSQDFRFFCTISRRFKIETIPKILLKMRQRSGSVSFAKGEQQDYFSAEISNQQLDIYFEETPLSQAEKADLRSLLRRYHPLQQQAFNDLSAEGFTRAIDHYMALFSNFCSVHQSDIDASQACLLHGEIEHHLPSLVRHALLQGWQRGALHIVQAYLSRYPRRSLPVIRQLAGYLGYYSLRTIKPLNALLAKIRQAYYRTRRDRQFS